MPEAKQRTLRNVTKAFDTLSRQGLWQTLQRLGCPPNFLKMIVQLHGQVRQSSNDLSESFPNGNGVKQGCVLLPMLFSIFFSMILQHAIEDLDD